MQLLMELKVRTGQSGVVDVCTIRWEVSLFELHTHVCRPTGCFVLLARGLPIWFGRAPP